jgi:site-specific recombinase XerD
VLAVFGAFFLIDNLSFILLLWGSMAEEITSLETAQKKFIDYLQDRDRASATILAYGKDIEQLISFLGKKQISHPASVSQEHIEEFKKSLAEKNYTAKSISRKLNSVKTFFRFLKSSGVIKEDPASLVAHPKYEIKPPRILTKMEYRALRDSARDDPRMSAVIELLLQTGMRIGELARLELEDIKEKEIKIKAYESHQARTIPLNQAAKKALERYLKVRPKSRTKNIFLTKTGRPLLIRNIRTAIDRYFRIAGIKDAKVNDLRHTFIAHQLMTGASVVLVSKLAGHKRLSTTEKYLDLVKEKVEERVRLEEL